MAMSEEDLTEKTPTKRRLGVATYFLASQEEVDELHELARLAGYRRLVYLVAEVMDAKREELRAQFGPLLEQARQLREQQ